MTYPSPERFTQPIRNVSAILDGVVLRGNYANVQRPIAVGAHHFEKGNGAVAIQTPLVAADRSIIPRRYAWTFAQVIGKEDETILYDRLAASGQAVVFVPYSVETEVFRLAAGDNDLTLARPIAEGTEPLFLGSPTHSNRAWIGSTEQTVVSTTPGAGEVQLSGSDCAVTGATAGALLVVRYYAAYSVFVESVDYTMVDDRNQVREVVMREAGL